MNVKQDKSGNGLPISRIETISNATVDASKVGYAGLKEEECRNWLLVPGDILFSHINSVEHVGKCAVYNGAPEKLIHGMNLLCLRCDPAQLMPEFAKYLIRSPQFRSRLSNFINKAVNQASVSIGNLKTIKVNVPSIAEQRRIASILNKADALRAKRREALAQLDSLSQSIFLEMFGDPVTNPKGWPVVSLTDICHCYSGGTPSKALTGLWVGKLPWFSAKDLKKNDLFDSQDHIAEFVTETTSLKLLPANTVTICVRGMILAHTFPVSVLRVPATINQDLKALLPKKPLDAQYLAACLRAQSEFVLRQVSEAGHGTKRLDAAGLREIRVLQPPENLRKAFTSLVCSIEILRTQHCAAVKELDALFIALQHRAFRGEL